jgi:hypothetical protein
MAGLRNLLGVGFKHKDSKERIYLHLLGQIRAKKYPHAATATLHEIDEE